MCQRHSAQQSQLSTLVQTKEQRINLLIAQVKQLQQEISQKDREISQFSQVKQSVKKLPYNMYKQFLVTTESDGSLLSLVKKRSLVEQERITFGDPKLSTHPTSLYQNYLLIKLQGDKPTLYLSANTQLSTIDKINLNKQKKEDDDRDSYSYVAPDLLQRKPSLKSGDKLKIQRKVLECQVGDTGSKRKVDISEEHKKLLMFPPSLSGEQKRIKEPLGLKGECQVLSQDLRKLKQKLVTYTRMMEHKKSTIPDNLKPFPITNNQVSQPKTNQTTDPIRQFIQSKINQVSSIDFNGLLQSKWKQQKQQYIEYISRLEKELKEVKGSQGYIAKESHSKSYIQNSPESEFKSHKMFQSSPYSEIGGNQSVVNGTDKYTIFKSDPELANRSYFKNQYHINETDKSRSKSKGKIMYIRR